MSGVRSAEKFSEAVTTYPTVQTAKGRWKMETLIELNTKIVDDRGVLCLILGTNNEGKMKGKKRPLTTDEVKEFLMRRYNDD